METGKVVLRHLARVRMPVDWRRKGVACFHWEVRMRVTICLVAGGHVSPLKWVYVVPTSAILDPLGFQTCRCQ
jgi:hypothetical protein